MIFNFIFTNDNISPIIWAVLVFIYGNELEPHIFFILNKIFMKKLVHSFKKDDYAFITNGQLQICINMSY